MTDRRVPPNPDAPAVSKTHAERLAAADARSAEGYDAIEAAGEAVAELARVLVAAQAPQVDRDPSLCSSGNMKIKGTITRVVPAAGDTGALVFFRPDDPLDLDSLRSANLTSSGEVIVAAGANADRAVGEQAEFELPGTEDDTKPDEPAPAPGETDKG
jgi:hypothetical protein